MPLFNASILTGSQQGNHAIIQAGGFGDVSGSGIFSRNDAPWQDSSSSPSRLKGSADTGNNRILYDPQGLIDSLIINASGTVPGNTNYEFVNSVTWKLNSAGTYKFTLIKQYDSYTNNASFPKLIDGVGLIASVLGDGGGGASSWTFEPVKLVLWETETANPSSGDPEPLTALESSNTVTITNDRYLYMVMRKDYLSYGGVYVDGTARIKIEKL
ncbi:MAG: hypothetical protein VW270_10800 [Candidatus Poseidoniales archaeon]